MSDQAQYLGGWSDWILTEDQTRYYRARRDETGAYHYEYSAPPAVDDPAVPRGDDTSLESAFGNVSLNDPYAHHYNQSYNQGTYGYTATQGGAGGAGVATTSAQHYAMAPPQAHSSSSRKGKGVDMGGPKSKKSSRTATKDRDKKYSSSKRQQGSSKHKSDPVDYQSDPFYEAHPPNTADYGAAHPQNTADYGEDPSDDGTSFQGQDPYQGTGFYPADSGDSTEVHAGTDNSADEYRPEHEKSEHRSHRQSKGKQSKPSSSGRRKQPLSAHPEFSGEKEFNEAVENSDAYNPGAGEYPEEEDPEVLTPRAGSPHAEPGLDHGFDHGSQPGFYYPLPSNTAPSYPSGSGSHFTMNMYPSHEDNREAILGDTGDPYRGGDDRYVVEPSIRFMPGEVFKILWSEPRGGREEVSVEEYESMGRKFYTGFRRFVIVANDEGHCTCVPILTYERRACTKKGVKPAKHGIVYPVYGKAQLLPKEPDLGFEPVRLELDYPTEKLAKESRINYSKLVTVEHNVSVFFIGRIVAEDFDIVTQAVDRCWADKLRGSGGGGGGESSHHRRRHR